MFSEIVFFIFCRITILLLHLKRVKCGKPGLIFALFAATRRNSGYFPISRRRVRARRNRDGHRLFRGLQADTGGFKAVSGVTQDISHRRERARRVPARKQRNGNSEIFDGFSPVFSLSESQIKSKTKSQRKFLHI